MKKRFIFTMVALFFVFSATLFNSCSKEQNDATNTPVVEKTDFSKMLGCQLTPKDEYEKIPLAPERTSEKAIAAYKILNYPPVGNQGANGSCVGWGTAYSVRSAMQVAYYGGTWSYSSNIFSPSYVYNQIKISDCGAGSFPSTALNLLQTQGVCPYNTMPYTSNCYTLPTSTQKLAAAKYKIRGYNRITISASSIKSQLNAGYAVVVAGPVDNYFQNLGYNQVLTYVSGSGGGHCYSVVGYDDSKNAFLVQNSWGTSWATNGLGWVSYNVVTRLWSEAYIMYL